jgi:hypothetical protein
VFVLVGDCGIGRASADLGQFGQKRNGLRVDSNGSAIEVAAVKLGRNGSGGDGGGGTRAVRGFEVGRVDSRPSTTKKAAK